MSPPVYNPQRRLKGAPFASYCRSSTSVLRRESSRRRESTLGGVAPRFLTAESSSPASRTDETSLVFPAHEIVVKIIQRKQRKPRVANKMRRPTSPRTLLPLAPSAARS